MELFFKQKNFDVSIILKVLDDLIDGNSDNIAKVEQAYKLKTECLFKLKRKEDAIKITIYWQIIIWSLQRKYSRRIYKRH